MAERADRMEKHCSPRGSGTRDELRQGGNRAGFSWIVAQGVIEQETPAGETEEEDHVAAFSLTLFTILVMWVKRSGHRLISSPLA